MDPDESPFARFGRTLWAALAYITTSVVRFLRTETDAAGVDGPSSREDDDDDAVTRETITQKCRSEHSEGGATEAEMAVGSPITHVHSHLQTVPWEKCEVVTDHHEEETNVYSVQYSKIRRRKTDLDSEKEKQECFEKRDDPKQDLAVENVRKQIQDPSISEDQYEEIMDFTVSHREHINDENDEADSLIKEVDDALTTKLNSLGMGDDFASGNSGIAEDSDPPGFGLAVCEVRGREEKMMVQEVDHGTDPEAETPQSRAIHTELEKAALCITLTEQRLPEPYASHFNQEEPGLDVTYNEQDTAQSTTAFIDQEEEIHILTHRLVEAVVMTSVEFVNNEMKTQEVHEEDHAQTSMTHPSSQDQRDSTHDLMEQQQPILNRPVEAMTVWYDEEAEGDTEVAEDEEHEDDEEEDDEDEEETLGGERPKAHVHDNQQWENTEQSEREKKDKARSHEANTDQNRHEEEEQSHLQATEDHISDRQPCEKEEDLVKEGVTVMEQENEDDTTVETTDDKCLQEEVAENSFEEDYVDGHIEEHTIIEEAEVMRLNSTTTAESAPQTDMATATSDVIKEDLPQVGQFSQEMNANAEEVIDGAIEVTDTSQDAAVEEPVGQKAEPPREERMEEGEKEEEEKDTEEEEEEEEDEEERDEFEGLRPAEESEDEGVSIDPDDTDVQEAHEGWHSEEGETEFTDDFTSPITEASDALLYEAESPEPERIETGTDASLLREDAELTTTEADVSLTSAPKDAERDTQWESQMSSQASERAAGSGCTESDLTSAIFSTTCDDGAFADSEFVQHSPGMVLQEDGLEEMFLDHSNTERELLENLSETFESKSRQQEEAELKIKNQLSNESKSLDESGCKLEIKRLTTTILTDKSDQEESVDIMMGSELVNMPKQSSKLTTFSVTPEAELIEVAEEQVEDLEKEAADPQIEINPLQSQSGSEDVARTSQWDALEEHEDDIVDSSERTESDEGPSEDGRCETETSLAERIMLIETEASSAETETSSALGIMPFETETSSAERIMPIEIETSSAEIETSSAEGIMVIETEASSAEGIMPFETETSSAEGIMVIETETSSAETETSSIEGIMPIETEASSAEGIMVIETENSSAETETSSTEGIMPFETKTSSAEGIMPFETETSSAETETSTEGIMVIETETSSAETETSSAERIMPIETEASSAEGIMVIETETFSAETETSSTEGIKPFEIETSSAEGIMAIETENSLAETETSSAEIMLIETEAESNFFLSETANAVPEKSLHPIQVITKGEVPQIQADADILLPDHQIHTHEAESRESQESEGEHGEENVEDASKTQTQDFCEAGSISSDEDKDSRETREESKAAGSNLPWEGTESDTQMLKDEMEHECRSVVESETDMNEETELNRAEESDGITETNSDNIEEGVQKALKEDMGEEQDEADVQHMAAMQVESGETSRPDVRLVLKRKLEDAVAETEFLKGEQDLSAQLPAKGITSQVQVSSLDFSIQKSRIAVKNPQVRPPKDPRTLLNLPSLEPTPRSAPQQESPPGQPDKKPPAFGVPLGGVGVIGVKLPGLGAGFPVLRKTNRGPKEEEKSESSPLQEKSETEKTEDTAEEVQTQSKPKWTPPKHAIGMGNPFMMAELKGKLKKPAKE